MKEYISVPHRSVKFSVLALISLLISLGTLLFAQPPAVKHAPESLDTQLQWLVETPAVSGHEADLAMAIRERVQGHSATTDNLGDVIVSFGSGAPHRIIAAPMDEPGYVVSDITHDGYLRVQRLPQTGVLPLFEELYSGQPVRIQAPSGSWLNGVVAGLSVHLRHPHPPSANDIDDMYIDIGASSADEARHAGADLLAPLVIDRQLSRLQSSKYSAPSIGDRFGDAALLQVIAKTDFSKISGTLTFVFLAQQWTGAARPGTYPDYTPAGRTGLRRAPHTFRPAPRRPQSPQSSPPGARQRSADRTSGHRRRIGQNSRRPAETRRRRQDSMRADYSAPLLHRSYLPQPNLPEKVAHLAIATEWPSTPAEEIDLGDLRQLVALLETYAAGAPSAAEQTPGK